MSRRVRVIAKRRREVDVDKLVFALLRILEVESAGKSNDARSKSPSKGRDHGAQESAA